MEERRRLASRPRFWATVASLAWGILILGYGVGYVSVSAGQGGGGPAFVDGLFFAAALVLPLLLIWLAAWLTEELAQQREVVLALAELTPPLLEALSETRRALEAQPPAASPEALEAALQAGVAAGVAAGIDRARAGTDQAISRLTAAEVRLEGLVRAARGHATAEPVAEASAPAAAVPAVTSPPPRRGSEPAAPSAPPSSASPSSASSALASAPAPTEAALAVAGSQPGSASTGHTPALPDLAEAEVDTRPDWPDLVRALDFPRDAGDHAGFRALREALRHRSVAQMLQSAEDVLTILAQHGIFMEEFTCEGVEADAIRRFHAGTRGAEVDAAGGIREEATLEKVRGLAQTDPIFRDAALFFQRRFDRMLADFLPDASDAQILSLADTRSGRAFMLLARTSGAVG